MIEKINRGLSNYPLLKKFFKRIYQLFFYVISPKYKKRGQINNITYSDIDDFFGYYDNSPWDFSQRFFIYISAKNMSTSICAKEPCDIILLDTINNVRTTIARTQTCNTQQGCMLQWLGPDFDKNIIYNDYIDGVYKSIIQNVFTSKKTIIDFPIYTVTSDGRYAYNLDFSRLHRLRPRYGYDNFEDITKSELCPDSPCIWKINLQKNTSTPLITYKQLFEFETRPSMLNAQHEVNHIMISPNDERIMFLHRWIIAGKKYSRLITCDPMGIDMYNLLDDDMVSHSNWIDNTTIITFAHKEGIGNGYYILTDKTKSVHPIFVDIKQDGHPSLSPDGKYVVTDTYPDKSRKQHIYLCDMNTQKVRELASAFAPFKYDNDNRCDLHPRFS